MITRESYEAAAETIRSRLNDFVPDTAIIAGSGLGFLGDKVADAVKIPFAEVPLMPPATAPGHDGTFAFGTLNGRKVAVMRGRVHTYEGRTPDEAAVPVRLLALLGCKTLIVTNASGAVNTDFKPGDLCLIADHIKLTLPSPLAGPKIFGDRFPDMTEAYSKRLRGIARDAAAEIGQTLREGVYMIFPGPQYETPAEIRAARALGADLVGMSTVPEVIAAGSLGMETLGISVVCNAAAGVLGKPLSETEVLEAADAAKPRLSALVLKILEILPC